MSNEKLTDSQLELKKRIEEKTAAEVHFEPRFSVEEKFTARIVREHFFTDEDGDLAKELIELSFITDQPRKKPMTEAQISAYPPELQNCFRTLFPDESCNVLPAASIADTPEKALEELLEMAGLLDFGWHLGEEANFSDPFCPHYGKNREVVAVYGGSFCPSAPAWIDAVRDFGRFLAAHGMTLLYGGGRGGVRQLLADTVLEIFRILYDHGYQIEKMRLIDDYGGDDDASCPAKNFFRRWHCGEPEWITAVQSAC